MDKIHNWINTGLIAVLMFMVLVGGNNQSAPKASGTSNFDAFETASLAVGSGCDNEGDTCTGTGFTQILASTGTLIGSRGITATSTSNYDIAVTGVVAGDKVIAQLPTTAPTASGFGPYVIVASAASSTSGFITVTVLNLSGVATSTITTTLQSGVKYWVYR